MILHHIGYVASNLQIALQPFALKDSDVIDEIYDMEQQNVIFVLPGNQSKVWTEIIVPIGANSTVYNSLQGKDFMLHHVAFQVLDIEQSLNLALQSPGSLRLGSYELVVPSFGGLIRTQFYYSSGAIFELVQLL